MTTPMHCIEGTASTNTVMGRAYTRLDRFVCSHCGRVSTILEFGDKMMTAWRSIDCLGCGRSSFRLARYGKQRRFVPRTDPDRLEQEVPLRGELVLDVLDGES